MVAFAAILEKSIIDTVEIYNIIIKDLATANGRLDRASYVLTREFLDAVFQRIDQA